MDLKDQNTQLLAALKYLMWTKDFKDNIGKCSAYEMHVKKSCKKANDIIDLCESQDSASEHTKALPLKRITNSTLEVEKIVGGWKNTSKYPCPKCGKKLAMPEYKCEKCNIKLKIKVKM